MDAFWTQRRIKFEWSRSSVIHTSEIIKGIFMIYLYEGNCYICWLGV